MKKTIALIFSIVLIGCKSEVNHNSTILDKEEIYQSIINSIYKSNPESIGIMVHIESASNDISWSGSSGYSDKEKKNLLTPDQPALIASSIKTYISAAVLRLQEKGTLNIEDPIDKHLSAKTISLFQRDGYQLDQIKIKHLLSHTSGIDDYVNDDYFKFIDNNQKYHWTRDEQLELATKVGDPLGKPQATFKYADANYLLATEIIEQKTGSPFYNAIRDLLRYKELGITHTWFPTLEEKPAQTSDLVHQYWNVDDWGPSKMNIAWDSHEHDISWDLYGGGGIATTMKELSQFSYSLFNGHIIKDTETLSLIFSDVVTADGKVNNYRLGVADTAIRGIESYGHGGFWGTIVFYIPQLDASISVCVLERNGKMKVIESVLNELIEELTEQIQPSETIASRTYALHKAKDSKATLILFPGGGSTSKETREEFDILTAATANNISVLLMNFNRHLFIDQKKTRKLSD